MLNIMPSRIFPFMTDYQLSAIPLFIFMAAMLERAGVIEQLFDMKIIERREEGKIKYITLTDTGKRLAELFLEVYPTLKR